MPDAMPAFTPKGPIAIISHTHPSVTKGGAEIAAYTLYMGLRQIGVDAIFVCVCAAEDRQKLMLGSDREFALIANPLRYDHFYQLASNDIWRQLKTLLTREKVRLINFHHFLNLGANTLRALSIETQIPFVVTLHEFLAICAHHGQMVTRPARRLCMASSPVSCASCFPEHSRQQFMLRTELLQSALGAAKAFVSPSHFLAERMIEWGLPAEKFMVIENGLRVVPDRVSQQRATHESGLWNFGYFGQLTPFKGGDVLLDAIEILGKQPDAGKRFRIRIHGNMVGQSKEFTSRFDRLVAENNFVSYGGPYDNADVHKLMAACDYVLMPSTWWENSPVVIQEAYAVGRPLICSNLGGMAEKVPNRRSGLHFRASDGADLARVMEEAADETLYQALCSGIPKVGDLEAMAREYLATFERLAGYTPEGGAVSINVPAKTSRRRVRAAVTV